MTVHDQEILELLRDEPELLALADAVAETQRPTKPRRLRVTVPRLLAVGAVVAAVIVAFLLAPGGGGNHGVIDRALAAIGTGRVLHTVTQSPTGTVFVDLKSGQRTVQMIEYEAWYDGPSKRFHLVERLHGQVVGDILFPEDAKKPGVTITGGIDPAFAALATGYRQALANGDAKLDRTGTLDGKSVYWLRFPSFQSNLPGTEVAIDRNTYKPVLFRNHFSRTKHLDERVLDAETTGFQTSDFTRLGPSLLDAFGSGSLSSGSSSSTPLPPGRHPKVQPPWLSPGTRAAGLKLTAVNPFTVTTHGRTIHGVQLVYGADPQRLFPAPLVIEELPQPDEPSLWKSIPRGSVSIQTGETGGTGGTHPSWTGYVTKRGIYATITIQNRGGERAVVQIARALNPPS